MNRNPENRTEPPVDVVPRGPDRGECRGEEGPPDVGDRVMELSRRLRESRRRLGVGTADAAWAEAPYDCWLRMLDDDGDEAARGRWERRDELVVGMTESLAIRDMVVLSLILCRQRADRETLLGFVRRPHRTGTQRRMGALLTEAFEDPDRGPDGRRCDRGSLALRHVGRDGGLPRRFRAQPLAVAAYALWWRGETSAIPLALAALGMDDGCSLAAIVASAAARGVLPASARRRGDGE